MWGGTICNSGKIREWLQTMPGKEGEDENAPGGIRTPNPLIRSQKLYPLSYRCIQEIILPQNPADGNRREARYDS